MKSSLSSLLLVALLFPAATSAARIQSSGFELQSATASVELGSTLVGVPAISTSVKRSGEASMRFNAAGSEVSAELYELNSGSFSGFHRCYVRFASFPSSLTKIVQTTDPSDHVSIRINSTGTLELWDDGSAAQVGSDSSALSLNTWYRIELRVENSIAGDGVTAYIDGVSFASLAALPAGEGHGEVIWGVQGSVTADMYVDDCASNNTTGSVQNLLPGEGSIIHMQPDGSAGDNNADTGSCADVDEVTPDDATTFAGLDSTGDIMDCTVESSSSAGIGSSDTITLVQVGARMRREDTSGNATYNTRIKSASGGTVTSGTVKTITGTAVFRTHDDTATAAFYSATSYTDPTTASAWTPTGTNSLDNMQIGATAPDATPDIHISTLWALVEYVPSAAPPATTDDTFFDVLSNLFQNPFKYRNRTGSLALLSSLPFRF